MSMFYGSVTGQARTTATRRGSRSSGITTSAQSWSGSVIVGLYERDGVTWCDIGWNPDSSGRATTLLLSCPLDQLVDSFQKTQ